MPVATLSANASVFETSALSLFMKQIPLALLWNTRPSLDSFVVGSNGLVLAHLQQVAHSRSLPVTPTYLWGASGSGKTHLLLAVRDALQAQGMSIGWLDATTPCDSRPVEFDDHWYAVLLDDVDRFDAAQQHTAFNWFVHALAPANGKPRWVLAAGQLPVADMPVREDLRTRLGWGQALALHPLSDAEVKQALQRAAQQRGLTLGDEVVAYMQTRFARNTGSLMTLLHLLDDYALQTGRAITIPLIRQMLEEES